MMIASDLEGTLTSGASWRAVGHYLEQHGRQLAYKAFLAVHLLGVPLVKTGLIDEQLYRNRWMHDLARLLKGMTSAELTQAAEWVVEHELWPKRRAALIEELTAFRAQGHQVILSTGAYQPVADAFARRIGAVAIGTPLEMKDKWATGRLAGPTNNGQYKADSLRRYLAEMTLEVAYGDTCADLPMLELSQTPIAVCPEPALRDIANERGWRIVTV
jgi:HAD superfamily phosphoserine phosphatase-like hydrolase